MSAQKSAKILTSAIAAAAMVLSLSAATPAAALNQHERNVVGGVVLGVIGTLAVQGARKNQKQRTYTTRVCHDPYQTYRNGHLVTVCR
ncbi:hypothetical protein [Sagittula stellata]|uniref:17 kDa surface antigen n=1 Tax=Sagittula stellata (strain ATCC 700073 / DSM 11524 / E-37) TaxID=388399 RepID=A3K1M5_SAGS3|nr:hypothetical protein [Sagittula stellata]EBA08821.1 hypothetical protein SSE37_04225 [Sagittula stellata E-37]